MSPEGRTKKIHHGAKTTASCAIVVHHFGRECRTYIRPCNMERMTHTRTHARTHTPQKCLFRVTHTTGWFNFSLSKQQNYLLFMFVSYACWGVGTPPTFFFSVTRIKRVQQRKLNVRRRAPHEGNGFGSVHITQCVWCTHLCAHIPGYLALPADAHVKCAHAKRVCFRMCQNSDRHLPRYV